MAVPAEARLSGEIGLSEGKEFDGLYWPEEDFQRVFLENYQRVASVLFRIVGDHSRAEDLAIEAFWRLYRQPFGKGGSGWNPSGWLYRTATRLGIDSLRAEGRRARYEREAEAVLNTRSRPDPLDDVLAAERRGQVRKTLAALKPEQAQLLILRASGFSYRELAVTLGVKSGSVGTMLIRAEAAFRKRYLRLYGNKEEI